LPSLSNQSTLQYLFSTRTKHTDAEEATPILGFGLLQEPCVLVALLHTGVVVDLSVIDLHYLPKIEQLEPVVNTMKKVIIIIVYFYIKNYIYLFGSFFHSYQFLRNLFEKKVFETILKILSFH